MSAIDKLKEAGRDPLEVLFTNPPADVAEWLQEDENEKLDKLIKAELDLWDEPLRKRLAEIIAARVDAALRARLAAADALIEAAVILRQRLSLVHENPLYRGVWATAQNHQGPYNGPTYIDELVLFDDALSAYRASAAPEAGGGLLYTQMTFWLGHVTGTGGTSALHYWPSICGTCKEIAEFLAVYRADAIAARANETFCCQSAEKMYELTDPSAPLPQSFGGTCATCGGDEPYRYHVPENLWRVIVPEKLWGEIVCAKCFHGFAISKVNQ